MHSAIHTYTTSTSLWQTGLTRRESLLAAEVVQRGREPASLVPAIHRAAVPSPRSEPPVQTSSREEYATALEQPSSHKLNTSWVCLIFTLKTYSICRRRVSDTVTPVLFSVLRDRRVHVYRAFCLDFIKENIIIITLQQTSTRQCKRQPRNGKQLRKATQWYFSLRMTNTKLIQYQNYEKVSYPIVGAGYIPKEMLRPFVDTRRIRTIGLRLLQYIVYAD